MRINFKTEKQKNPTRNDGFNVIYAPAKRLAFKLRWYLLISLIISPILFFTWYMIENRVLISAEGILTSEPIQINASQSSFVLDIKVIAGEKVNDKQIIIQLTSPKIEQQYNFLSAQYKTFKAHHNNGLKSLEALYLRKISTYKAAKYAQQKINKEFKVYGEQGILPLTDRLLIEQNSVAIEGLYQQALIDYESAVNEHLNGQLANTLLNIELALSDLETKKKLLTILSPKNGTINQVFVKQGEFISEGNPLFSISNLTQSVIHVYLSPERMNFAEIGQTANITLPNGDEFVGTINRPTQMSEKLPSILSGPFDGHKPAIKVYLSLDKQPDVVIEGLPVGVRFHYFSNKQNND